MDFGQALHAMRNGQRVRNRKTGQTYWSGMICGRWDIYCGDKENGYQLGNIPLSFLNSKWEIVEEPHQPEPYEIQPRDETLDEKVTDIREPTFRTATFGTGPIATVGSELSQFRSIGQIIDHIMDRIEKLETHLQKPIEGVRAREVKDEGSSNRRWIEAT